MIDVNSEFSLLVKSAKAWAVTLEEQGSPLKKIPIRAKEVSEESVDSIRARLGDCKRCVLSKTRKEIVFGEGNPNAALMFIGEAPGAQEDKTGRPFVGRAGQLLEKMIVAMGWSRNEVYITNVLKCRPPDNRDPKPEEVAACKSFLASQIQSVSPSVVVTLGRPAAQLVLNTDAPISALRGRFQECLGKAVMPTFHPAYLLRSPERKREAWADLQLVMEKLKSMGVEPK